MSLREKSKVEIIARVHLLYARDNEHDRENVYFILFFPFFISKLKCGFSSCNNDLIVRHSPLQA